jgi:hypothetical protein
LGEFHIGIQAVGADADDLRVQLLKCFQITLEVNQFVGSNRREGGKIECQNDVFLAKIVG